MKSSQDLFSVAFVVFKIERSTQAVCPDDGRVIRKRELDQGDKTGKAALPWRHFFAHHARVAVTEEKNQSTFGDPVRAKISGLLNYVSLCALQPLEELHSLIKE